MLILVNDLEGFQSLAVFPVTVSKAREHSQYLEIAFDLLLNAGTQYLDDDFAAVMQLRRVNLGNRCGRERFNVESLEDFVNIPLVRLVQNLRLPIDAGNGGTAS